MKSSRTGGGNYGGARRGLDANGEVICEGCFKYKLELELLREENQRLKHSLRKRKPVSQEGAHTPSSRVAFKKGATNENVKRRGGAKKGHKGHGRITFSKEDADSVIEAEAPSICSDCKAALVKLDIRERSIIDTEEVTVKKVTYRIGRSKCAVCSKIRTQKLPVLPRALYGNSLIAQAAVMHYLHGVTIGKTCQILGPLLKPAGLIAAFHKLAKFAQPLLAQFVEDYRNSPVRHADETGWRNDGRSGWVWNFCSSNVSIFTCQPTRSSKVPLEILGTEPLDGVLIVDRFAAYNKVPCSIQYCFAHLKRDVEKLKNEFNDNTEVVQFADTLSAYISRAMIMHTKTISDLEYFQQAQKLADSIRTIVSAPASHLGIINIQEIFLKNETKLYHWVNNRLIPAHNNFAEREIRQTVIARKVSFGSQSEKGAETRSILTSLMLTLRKRIKNQSVEAWIKNALDEIASNNLNTFKLLFPKPT